MSGARRPGVVTFIGVILYIQAVAGAAYGIVAFLERNNDAFQLVSGQSDSDLIVFAIVEIVFALVLLAVANGVMGGAKWARMLVGLVAGLRFAILAWWMISHHAGGIHTAALVQMGIYVFVLWALYGHKESEEFFDAA